MGISDLHNRSRDKLLIKCTLNIQNKTNILTLPICPITVTITRSNTSAT